MLGVRLLLVTRKLPSLECVLCLALGNYASMGYPSTHTFPTTTVTCY
jgi:hypothetical protein